MQDADEPQKPRVALFILLIPQLSEMKGTN